MLDKLIFNSGSNPTSKSSLSVDLTPLTIFVGPNNSGKSRALIDIENQLTTRNAAQGEVIKQILIKPLSEDEAKRKLNLYKLSQTGMKSMRGMLFYLG